MVHIIMVLLLALVQRSVLNSLGEYQRDKTVIYNVEAMVDLSHLTRLHVTLHGYELQQSDASEQLVTGGYVTDAKLDVPDLGFDRCLFHFDEGEQAVGSFVFDAVLDIGLWTVRKVP